MSKQRCPWPDYAGNPIYDGDTIRHPDGLTGTVVFDPSTYGSHVTDAWRVDYGDGYPNRLCLQVGSRGMGTVTPGMQRLETEEKLDLLIDAVLKWWKTHEYDTFQRADGDEDNVYGDDPDFVVLAKKIRGDFEGRE